jgi:hypothetical protein
MLIILNDSISDLDLMADEHSCIALQNLITCSLKGEHFVTGSRAVLNWLSEQESISIHLRKKVKRIENWVAQRGDLLNVIKRKIIVDSSVNEITKLSENHWCVPLIHFYENGTSPSVILAESLVDVDLLYEAAIYYKFSKGIRAINIRYEPRSGGGSTIFNVLDQIKNSRREFCLCITDSDKKSPNCPQSSTSRKCESLCNDASWVVEHAELSVHEIENLIPIEILENSLSVQLELDKFDLLKSRTKILGGDYYKFCDLKVGFTLKNLKSLDAGNPRYKYWKEVLDRLSSGGHISEFCELSEIQCTAEDCSCVLAPGFGDGLLSKIITKMKQTTPTKFHESAKDSFMINDWLSIGRIFFEFSCCPDKDRL